MGASEDVVGNDKDQFATAEDFPIALGVGRSIDHSYPPS